MRSLAFKRRFSSTKKSFLVILERVSTQCPVWYGPHETSIGEDTGYNLLRDSAWELRQLW
jgi:hypothetical protein